jgi:hypothetical protein
MHARSSTRSSLLALLFALVLVADVQAAPAPAGVAIGSAATPTAAPLASGAIAHHLSAEVVGYLPYWQMTSTTLGQLDLGKLSEVILFSVGWDAAGHLVTTASGYRAITSSTISTFIAAAHAAGVRVALSFTSFGLAKNTAFFGLPSAQATFMSEATALVSKLGLDGADLDVELIGSASFGAYAAVAGGLRSALRSKNPVATVSVATNGNTSGAKMAAAALRAGADRAFLMGYSYRTAGSAPGPIDPLARPSGLSLQASLGLYAAAGVPLDHVLLGLPLYGRRWATADATPGSPALAGVTGSGDTFLYSGLDALAGTGTVVVQDEVAGEVATRLVTLVGGVTWQSFYDSRADLEAKMTIALTAPLAGVGFWALGYANGRPEYWAAIADVFGPPALDAVAVKPSPTNHAGVSLALRWRDGGQPATKVRLASDGGSFGPWQPLAATVSWTVPAGARVARHTVRVQLSDDLGAQSAIRSTTVLYDAVSPTRPSLSLVWSSTRRAWILRYAGRDVGSGVAGYQIVVKRNGRYTTVARLRTSRSYVLRLPRTAHFMVAVRTIDRAGNRSVAAFRSH